MSARRYRYTGKEKDEETGLYYHGARYYAPWLGRWTAADPSGVVDGANLYGYCSGNPIALTDPDGRADFNMERHHNDAPAWLTNTGSGSPSGFTWTKSDGTVLTPVGSLQSSAGRVRAMKRAAGIDKLGPGPKPEAEKRAGMSLPAREANKKRESITSSKTQKPLQEGTVELKPINDEDPSNQDPYYRSVGTVLVDEKKLGRVEVWARQADLPFPVNQFDHHWIRTDEYESGMGAREGEIPGQDGNIDIPYITQTKTIDHSGQADAPNAHLFAECYVDIECVNKLAQPGRPTGAWSLVNQCQTFVSDVIDECLLPGTTKDFACRYAY